MRNFTEVKISSFLILIGHNHVLDPKKVWKEISFEEINGKYHTIFTGRGPKICNFSTQRSLKFLYQNLIRENIVDPYRWEILQSFRITHFIQKMVPNNFEKQKDSEKF